MRWKSKERQWPTTRRRWKFLFLPLTCNGETRWLEWAYVEMQLGEDMGSMGGPTWNITRFLDVMSE
jgi:hypothetical protein